MRDSPTRTSLSPALVPAHGLARSWSTPYGPKVSVGQASALMHTEPFLSWPELNDEAVAMAVGVGRRSRLMLCSSSGPRALDALLEGDDFRSRFARALAARRACDRKEFFENFEFFERSRRVLRPIADGGADRTLVDVGGGHGLLAALFATFEAERFSRVLVADTTRPPAFDAVVDSLREVAPWAADRLEYAEGAQADFLRGEGARLLPRGCAVACVHGCGSLTDSVIEAAAAADSRALAIMPCCYGGLAKRAPAALRSSLGVGLTADVERTYRLEAAGYRVKWRALPVAITPLNRLILARRDSTARPLDRDGVM